jgi:hypothetical protein
MRIDSSGNVGIGVTDPSTWSLGKALHIGTKENNLWGEGDYAFHMNQNAYYNGGWKYSHTDEATQYLQADGQHIWSYAGSGSANAALSWSEAMRIDSSGNLLVGKTATNYQTVGVEAKGNGSLWATADGNGPLVVTRKTSDGTLADFYKDTTKVGSIGANSSAAYFVGTQHGLIMHTGDVRPCTNTGANDDNSLDLGASFARFKDAHFSGTVNAANFNTTSDATLKTNVETLSGSLDAVTSLRGVSFDWLENGGSEIGVIAQEVEAVLPDVVSTNDEGIKSVKYGNMVAVLIEAIKEQQAQIDELKAKLGE